MASTRGSLHALAIGLLGLLGGIAAAAAGDAPAYPGQVVHGFDYASPQVARGDWRACQQLCDANGACKVWSLVSNPGEVVSYCYLKHTTGPFVPWANIDSGVRTPTVPIRLEGGAPEQGFGYKGNDFRDFATAREDWQSCARQCDEDGSCKAWSLYSPMGDARSYCWMKNAVGALEPAFNTVSGLKRERSTAQASPSPAAPKVAQSAPAQPAPAADQSMPPSAPTGAECRAVAQSQVRHKSEQIVIATSLGSAEDVREFTREKERAERLLSRISSATGRVRSEFLRLSPDSLTANVGVCEGLVGGSASKSSDTAQSPSPAPPPAARPTADTVMYAQPLPARIDMLEPLYEFAPPTPSVSFFSSMPRVVGEGLQEMYVVLMFRKYSEESGRQFDTVAEVVRFDCPARTLQIMGGYAYLDVQPAGTMPAKAPFSAKPGGLYDQLLSQWCDNKPLPRFAGGVSQVRRSIPVAP
jgi:hypothetical protein